MDAILPLFLLGNILLAFAGVFLRRRVRWLFIAALFLTAILAAFCTWALAASLSKATPWPALEHRFIPVIAIMVGVFIAEFLLLLGVYRWRVRQPRAPTP